MSTVAQKYVAYCPAFLLFGAELLAIDVGVAKVDVTPSHPVVLAGFGGRTKEHEGIDTRIWARALAIGGSTPVLLIAVDNCGVPDEMTALVGRRLAAESDMDADRLVICSTHTHSAPALPGYAAVLWGGRLTEPQLANKNRYAMWLADRLVEVGLAALKSRRAASLEWAMGDVGFGGNRRVLSGGRWRGFGFRLDGPVDRSLPLLVAKDASGRPFALWTNYACHCTTLGARNRVSGDWAGFSNEAIEATIAGVTALTTIGCGADIGPQPTGSAEHARAHGRAIATEVKRLVQAGLKPLAEAPKVQTRQLRLPFDAIADRDHFESRAGLQNFDGEHARRMIAVLDERGAFPTHLDYPVTTWRFGDDLAIVFLAGEVVVDYAVRLKQELDWSRLWINAWSDDVPSYIPSKRVLREGGYEAGFSQIYYELPARYAPATEDIIVRAVREMVGDGLHPRAELGPSPFHVHPDLDVEELSKPPKLTEAERDALRGRAAEALRKIRDGKAEISERALEAAVRRAQNGLARIERNDGGVDSWFNYTGTKRFRPYIRQLRRGDTISWTTPPLRSALGDRVTLIFIAGLGYLSQPKTDGFELLVAGKPVLRFDVTTKPSRWPADRDDENFELLYLPSWTSSEDSAGFFLLTLPSSLATTGKALEIGVRSQGEGSLRWFSIDYYRDTVDILNDTLDFAQ